MNVTSGASTRRAFHRAVDPIGGRLATVTVAIGLLLGAMRLLALPATIGTVVVSNGAPSDVSVFVSSGGRDGWTPVGVVPHGSTVAYDDVIDQGARWVVRFVALRAGAVEVEMTRADLERAGWRLTVPDEIVTRG